MPYLGHSKLFVFMLASRLGSLRVGAPSFSTQGGVGRAKMGRSTREVAGRKYYESMRLCYPAPFKPLTGKTLALAKGGYEC